MQDEGSVMTDGCDATSCFRLIFVVLRVQPEPLLARVDHFK